MIYSIFRFFDSSFLSFFRFFHLSMFFDFSLFRFFAFRFFAFRFFSLFQLFLIFSSFRIFDFSSLRFFEALQRTSEHFEALQSTSKHFEALRKKIVQKIGRAMATGSPESFAIYGSLGSALPRRLRAGCLESCFSCFPPWLRRRRWINTAPAKG